MSRPLVGILLALALATAPGIALAARAPAAERRRLEAESLYLHAQALLGQSTLETRRAAIADLERATLLEPEHPEYQLALARACQQAGFLHRAAQYYERVAALTPDDAEARFGLGQVWRRDWLHYLDERSLDRAIDHFAAAARLDPAYTDAWLLLSSLLVERGRTAAARAAAEQALAADPGRAEALLAAGSTRWRGGDVGGADSAFHAALPKLRRSVRERFEDIAPIASERDTAALHRLGAPAQAEFARRFWADHDPDLATPENEAQLEYWARVAQAYFLFYDPRRREWDERGEVYVRYGPPEKADYNPVGAMLYTTSSGEDARFVDQGYPANVLVWSYPHLGMAVTMQDRALTERFQLPASPDEDFDPRPDPDSLAQLDAVSTPDARGVFPALPPGARPLPVTPQIARFEGALGAHLFAGVGTAGTPSDTLEAQYVVLDSARREVARVRRALAPSACAPADERVADFASDLPPGDYRVGLSLRGPEGRRGSARADVHVPAPDSALGVSDLVLTCGAPDASTGPFVRLEPNPLARAEAGEPLVAYFEVYRLAPGADGAGRFEYETTVRSAREDTRFWLQRWISPRPEPPAISAIRRDEVHGPTRRQFVSVPVQSLPPGPYRLDVTVRDLVSGAEATRSVTFEHEAAPAPSPGR